MAREGRAHCLLRLSWPDRRAIPLELRPRSKHPREPAGGAGQRLLQAWEIFEGVRLDADLVTLGLRQRPGERDGWRRTRRLDSGLTRAFQYAGARSVLASLWSVSDDSTADLMGRFYRRLRQGESKDVALRAAQVEMLGSAQFSHPALWAAFQLSGDWK